MTRTGGRTYKGGSNHLTQTMGELQDVQEYPLDSSVGKMAKTKKLQKGDKPSASGGDSCQPGRKDIPSRKSWHVAQAS